MATLSEVQNAMSSWKPEVPFTPYYNMNTLVSTYTVFLQNGETLNHEEITLHNTMTPDAATYLARDASVIVQEIFNALVNEVAAEGEISLGDRIVAENALAPPARRTPAEQANDDAKQASLVDVSFLPSDIR